MVDNSKMIRFRAELLLGNIKLRYELNKLQEYVGWMLCVYYKNLLQFIIQRNG